MTVGADDEQQELLEQEAPADDFLSDEARLDFERARRNRIIVLVVFLTLVLGGLAFLVWGLFAGSKPGGGPQRAGDACPKKLPPVGDPNAKIKIQCIAPTGSGCHDPIIQLLKQAAKRRKKQFYVTFSDMHRMGENMLKKTVGQVCAGVVINGKVTFTIQGKDGKKRKISLVGTAPANFSLRDLADVLTAVYVRTYGPLKNGPLVDLTKIPGATAGETSPKNAIGSVRQQEKKNEGNNGKANLDLELPALENLKLNSIPGGPAASPPAKGGKRGAAKGKEPLPRQ